MAMLIILNNIKIFKHIELKKIIYCLSKVLAVNLNLLILKTIVVTHFLECNVEYKKNQAPIFETTASILLNNNTKNPSSLIEYTSSAKLKLEKALVSYDMTLTCMSTYRYSFIHA